MPSAETMALAYLDLEAALQRRVNDRADEEVVGRRWEMQVQIGAVARTRKALAVLDHLGGA